MLFLVSLYIFLLYCPLFEGWWNPSSVMWCAWFYSLIPWVHTVGLFGCAVLSVIVEIRHKTKKIACWVWIVLVSLKKWVFGVDLYLQCIYIQNKICYTRKLADLIHVCSRFLFKFLCAINLLFFTVFSVLVSVYLCLRREQERELRQVKVRLIVRRHLQLTVVVWLLLVGTIARWDNGGLVILRVGPVLWTGACETADFLKWL